MRLNSALVSSFLFGSAVLADFRSEKQQPPFINRDPKPIDPPAVFPYEPDQWAGAVLLDVPEATIVATAATFTIPGADSTFGLKGFSILVSVGGFDDDCAIGVGITAFTQHGNGSAYYKAWGLWKPGRVQHAPDSFSIMTGHVLRAAVLVYSQSSSLVALMNLTTKAVWVAIVHPKSPCPGLWDANWVVTTIPITFMKQLKVPDFHSVSFTGITVQLYASVTPKVPDGEIKPLAIKQDRRDITTVIIYKDFVIIRYTPVL